MMAPTKSTRLRRSSSLRDWIPVFCLSFSVFIFNTTEFAPIGLLSDIAWDLQISEAKTGSLITIYAWFVAVTSLPFMLLSTGIERRKLLIILFVIFIVSHILSGLATNFEMLMFSRLGIACAHAVFWSITAPLAVRIAPPGGKAKALGLLATGSSLAMVLGLPLGRTVGLLLGWRATFLGIAFLALIGMLVLMSRLPRLPSEHAGSLKSLPLLFRRPALVGLYLLTAIIITAHFAGYAYIEPFLLQIGHFSAGLATLALLAFGFSGIVGSVIFTRYGEKYPFGSLLLPILIIFFSLLLLAPVSFSPLLLFGLLMIWGTFMMILALTLQTKIIQLAPDATDIAMSIHSGIFNIGIGSGALLGGLTITYQSLNDIGWIGSLIAVPAALLALFLARFFRQTSSNAASKTAKPFKQIK